jgi:hypothetical protein
MWYSEIRVSMILKRVTTLLLAGAMLLYLNEICSPGLIQPIQTSDRFIYSTPFITYTDSVTVDQRENILYAVNMWKKALHNEMLIQEIPPWEIADKVGTLINDRCQPVVLFDVVTSSDQIIKNEDAKNNVTTLGLTITQNCDVTKVWLVKDRLINDNDFIVIAVHEFGHVLGLKHVKSKKAIMHRFYYSADSDGCITFEDAQELCSHYDCRPNKVVHCD